MNHSFNLINDLTFERVEELVKQSRSMLKRLEHHIVHHARFALSRYFTLRNSRLSAE